MNIAQNIDQNDWISNLDSNTYDLYNPKYTNLYLLRALVSSFEK